MDMEPGTLGQPAVNRRGLVRAVVIQDEVDVQLRRQPRRRWSPETCGTPGRDGADATGRGSRHVLAPAQQTGWWSHAACSRGCDARSARAASATRLRAIERLYLGLFVHAQDQRVVRWVHIQADDVADLVDEQRVFGQLERLAAMRVQPEGAPDAADGRLAESVRAAIARVLQCVASRGVRSSVRTITRSTSASVILRGAPGRGSSSNPGNRFRTKRCRQRPTVCRVTPAVAAISPLVLVDAHASTRRARWARPCAVVGRRAHCSSVCRSSAVSTTSGVGRPVRIDVLRVYTKNVGVHQFVPLFSTQDTSAASGSSGLREGSIAGALAPRVSRSPGPGGPRCSGSG